MAGNKNSGRKKLYDKPKELHFTIEESQYDKLLIVMKNDGYEVFNDYMKEVVRRLLE